jgi:two-component system cell cycle sensor histidine kinase/response regulator CckA
MAQSLRLLIAEDSPADAELVIRALRRSGFAPEWTRVDNEADFLAGLNDEVELVLSDFDMPQFTGFVALQLVQQRMPDVPLIIVSGTIGEEVAVEAMRRGAADYLLKDRLSRLGPAVKQTLAKGRLQRERRQAVEALRQSEEGFRGMIENSTDVITVIDSEGRICFHSPSTQRILGYPADELMGRNAFDFVAPEDVSKVGEGIKRAWAGSTEPMPVEYRVRHRDGSWRIFQSIGRGMTDSTGRQQVVINSRDLTETRKLEQQFLRAQRLEAIGTLSSGIAHDLNNILAPMLMIAPLLKEKVSDRQDLEMLTMIEQGARRGANIIKQLLTFSRGIEGERGPVQARHLVKEMSEIMRETFPREISVEEKIEANLRPITADATQIHQVLMNLCVNARDAMPQGGKITITARNLKVEKSEAAALSQRRPGLYVCLTVADTGEGIPAGNLDRIFEPFYTTKELGKGTGLGLSTVLGIVKSHGGFVTVVSEPGRGTAFHVHLPASAGAKECTEQDAGARTRGRQELILVVDDEEPIRRSLCLFLVRENYRVLAAADGHDALTQFANHRDEVGLVLTDVMMPGMNGVVLIGKLRALAPKLRIVAASGLHDQIRSEELEALGVTSILVKPCEYIDILDAVQRELEIGASGGLS